MILTTDSKMNITKCFKGNRQNIPDTTRGFLERLDNLDGKQHKLLLRQEIFWYSIKILRLSLFSTQTWLYNSKDGLFERLYRYLDHTFEFYSTPSTSVNAIGSICIAV